MEGLKFGPTDYLVHDYTLNGIFKAKRNKEADTMVGKLTQLTSTQIATIRNKAYKLLLP